MTIFSFGGDYGRSEVENLSSAVTTAGLEWPLQLMTVTTVGLRLPFFNFGW